MLDKGWCWEPNPPVRGSAAWWLAFLWMGLLCLAVQPAIGMAAGKAGRVDPSFGKRGLITQSGDLLDGRASLGADMAIDARGRIYLLKNLTSCYGSLCTTELFVQRLLRNGAVDPHYGADGSTRNIAIGSHDVISGIGGTGSLAVTPRGVALVAVAGSGDVVLARFGRRGRIDRRFGADGVAVSDLGGTEVEPRIARGRGGTILLAVVSRHRSGPTSFSDSVVLARYRPDGTEDPAFGAGLPGRPGSVVLSRFGGGLLAFGLTPSGGLVVAGSVCCQAAVKFARRSPAGASLLRRSPSGRSVRVGIGPSPKVQSLVPLARGRLYLVVQSARGVFVAKLLPSGRLDRSFGARGLRRLSPEIHPNAPAVVDHGGKLYAAVPGSSASSFDLTRRVTVARLTRKGRIDHSWGAESGYAALPRAMTDATAMAFQPSGKLVVFGHWYECVRACPTPTTVLTRLVTRAPRR